MYQINNYKNLETAVINEMELRQEMKDRNSEIKLLIKKLANEMNIKNFMKQMKMIKALLLHK